MAVVLARLRAESRARWRSWLALAVLAGLVGGGTIAALAGARRTETAYPRFVAGTNAFDVMFTNGGTTEDNANLLFDLEEVRGLSQVTDAVLLNIYAPNGTTPSGRSVTVSDIVLLADDAGRFGRDMNRAQVLEGRLPQAPDELALTFLAADQLGVGLGDVLQLRMAGPVAASSGEASAMESFRVVGVMAMEGGFPPLTGGLPPLALLSASYVRTHPDSFQAFAVRLRGGRTEIPGFQQELNRLAGDEQVVATDEIELTSVVQRSLGVQATALRLLAVIIAVVALLLLAQAAARQAFLDSDDDPVLLALGMTRGQLRLVSLVRALPMALVAASVAFVTALALSALTPIGVARHAELNPGVALNAAYVGCGVAAVFLIVAMLAVLAGWWSARRSLLSSKASRPPSASSRLADTLSAARFPAPAVCGVRMALEQGRGRSAVPVRSTMASAILGVATIAGVLSFSASLGELFDDPRNYGWNWDIQIGDPFAPALGEEADRLVNHSAVRAAAVGTISRLQIGSIRVDALATEVVRGALAPTVVEGRPPNQPTEIMLGTRTLRDLGVGVGSTVSVAFSDRTADMRVVGRGVFTEFSGAGRLGEGAAVTLEGLRRLVPEATADLVLLRLDPTPETQALITEIRQTTSANVYLPFKPSDLADLERVGGLPSIVAGILSVMAVATLAHTLTTSARRRRRDLAILKVLGFVRSQVSATVAWQSTVIAAVAVLLGLPLGIASSRWGWQLFADELGVPPQPATPVLALALLVVATLLLANVVAAVPARLAARTHAAAVLRAE